MHGLASISFLYSKALVMAFALWSRSIERAVKELEFDESFFMRQLRGKGFSNNSYVV